MQYGLATLIGAALENIGKVEDVECTTNLYAMKFMAQNVINGIQVLEKMWPDLSKDEKQEIRATIEFIKTTYLISDEQILRRNDKK